MNMTASALLEVNELVVTYRPPKRPPIHAVASVSFQLVEGKTLALIGESGSGKSTIARAVCGLEHVESGQVLIDGSDLCAEKDGARAAGARGVQVVFQDPTSALNPRWPVWRSITEPLLSRRRASKEEHLAIALDLLVQVGLHASMAQRRPRELSGGQRQRVVIARALANKPRLIVLDEPVSALDVSVRNEILVLLDALKRTQGLTYLLISHDMGAVIQLATDVAVLYLGKLVESGPIEEVVRHPIHPYTQALIRAVPTVHGRRLTDVQTLVERPSAPGEIVGCPFHPRCPMAVDVCSTTAPVGQTVRGRIVACHRALEVPAGAAEANCEV